jgi:predicted dehydrogenase
MKGASGALDLLGVHLIDLFAWMHSDIEWVQAYSTTLHASMRGDDVTTAIYGLADGVTAVMETTYCSFLNEQTPLYIIEVNGTKGNAVYCLERGQLHLQLKDSIQNETITYTEGTWAHFQFEHTFVGGGALHQVHQDFVNCLQLNKPYMVNGTTGKKAIQVIEATRKAAKSGVREWINS